jgi:hypothetical protein
MSNQIEIVSPVTRDGVEFYTSNDGKLNGVSQVGTARLCGVDEKTIRRLLIELMDRTKVHHKMLEHLVGADLCLGISSPQQAKVLDSKVVAVLISYYAIEKGSQIAMHSLSKFAAIGINTWIQGVTGFTESNDSMALLNSINLTMGKLLVKVEKLEEIETETLGYRKATASLPLLEKWMIELSEIEKEKLLAPAVELFTIKEAVNSTHPGCTFSATILRKLALKVGQTITALSDKPNLKKKTPNSKGYDMEVNAYTSAQLPLIKLCLQTIIGEG